MNGLELPPSIKKFYNAEMREIAARSYTLFTSNALQQRLRGGITNLTFFNEYLFCTYK